LGYEGREEIIHRDYLYLDRKWKINFQKKIF
jgi:hypothetical protein